MQDPEGAKVPWRRILTRKSAQARRGTASMSGLLWGTNSRYEKTLLDVSRALIRLGMQLFAVSGKFKRLTVCELHRALRVSPNG